MLITKEQLIAAIKYARLDLLRARSKNIGRRQREHQPVENAGDAAQIKSQAELLSERETKARARLLFESFVREWSAEPNRQELIRRTQIDGESPSIIGPALGFQPSNARSIVSRFRKQFLKSGVEYG